MGILKEKYEISLWDLIPESGNLVEEKLAIIGGSNIESPNRCSSPILSEKNNGISTLTFSMYTHYFDIETNQFVGNPFYGLMQNERTVKLHFIDSDEWYDFIIKEINDTSDQYKKDFICENAYVCELGRSGYNLEFETELENNQDTAENLAAKILDGTDWSVNNDLTETILQYQTEPLYEYVWNGSTTTFHNVLNPSDTINIRSNDYLYGFYSQKEGIDGSIRQFIISPDRGRLVSGQGTLDRVIYPTYTASTLNLSEGNITGYKGSRLIQANDNNYDAKIDEYYTNYSKDNHIYRVFSEVEYVNPVLLTNWIGIDGFIGLKTKANSTSTSYDAAAKTSVYYYPSTKIDINNTKKYYKWEALSASNPYVFYNFTAERSKMKNISKGQKYVLKIKGYRNAACTQALLTSSITTADILTFQESRQDLEKFFIIDNKEVIDDYLYIYLKYNNISLTSKELLNNTALKLRIGFPTSGCYIEDIQFFPYYLDNDENLIEPGDIDTSDIIRTYYNVYDANQSPIYTSKDDLQIIDRLTKEQLDANYTIQKRNNFSKVRSIIGSKSNRFNLLQEICESFECWLHFDVAHDNIGKIVTKKIYFTNYNGSKRQVGFINGINLISAQNNSTSQNLATKLIVEANANEFATSGSCNIARANSNYSKENVLYNLDYYIDAGLLDGQLVNKDFYDADGWYNRLHQLNINRDTYINELTTLTNTLIKLNANISIYDIAVNDAIENKNQIDHLIQQLTGFTFDQRESIKDTDWENTKLQNYMYQYSTLEKEQNNYSIKLSDAGQERIRVQTRIDELNSELSIIADDKLDIHKEIFNKYSKYIQEGSWISEDYFDDELYYLDAKNTLLTAAFPRLSYTIRVIDVGVLEGYEAYNFKVGDITFVQDTDFFGWNISNGLKTTPIQKSIVISEIQKHLDDPSQNTITVQEYCSEFDNLFQRINATTQTLQYKGGTYNRASEAINTDGSIKYSAIAGVLKNNSIELANIGKQSVVIDDDGITLTDSLYPNNKLRMVSKGVYLSNDNGETYNSAITSNGINTALLTAGTINVEKINVLDGSFPSFRWDKYGINAFKPANQGGYDLTTSVRFDHFGLYGIANQEDIFNPSTEADIWDNENIKYALTWKGFKLRTDNGAVTITSDSDIQVLDENNAERIKIGNIGTSSSPIYGININNSSGNSVFQTNENGDITITGSINATSGSIGNVEIGSISVNELVNDIKTNKWIQILGGTAFLYGEDSSIPTPSQIILYSSIHGTSVGKWFYINGNGVEIQIAENVNNITILPNDPYFINNIATIIVRDISNNVYAQHNITKIYNEGGTPGRSINDVIPQWCTYDDSIIAPPQDYEGWGETIPEYDEDNPYIWRRDKITWSSDPLVSYSTPQLDNIALEVRGLTVFRNAVGNPDDNYTTILGGKIQTGSITANQIAAGTITGEKINIGNMITAINEDDSSIKIAANKIDIVANNSYRQNTAPTSPKNGDLWYCTSSTDTTHYGKWWRYNGTTWQECSDPRIAEHETRITQNATNITLEATAREAADTTLDGKIDVQAGKISIVVDNSNKVKAGIIVDAINDAGSTVKIDADHIVLDGDVAFKSSLAAGTTTVSGGCITADTLNANTIVANSLSGTIWNQIAGAITATDRMNTIYSKGVNSTGALIVYTDVGAGSSDVINIDGNKVTYTFGSGLTTTKTWAQILSSSGINEYVKTATVSSNGKTLTLTKQDETTVVFTPNVTAVFG